MSVSLINSPAARVSFNPFDSQPLGSNRAWALPQNQSTLIHAVRSVNDNEMFGSENELTFAIDRAARLVVIRLVNKSTREVVEQIPGGIVLQLAEELNTQHGK